MKINIFNKQKKFEEEVLSGEYAVGDMEYSSYYKDSFKRLKKNKMSMFCLFVILLLILIAIFAPLLAPYDPTVQDYASILQGPSKQHLLGTDEYGRDILSRIIYGTRISLSVGILAQVIATIIGVTMGSLAAYYGGWVDTLISRIMEIFAAFPDLIFAMAIMYVLGAGMKNIFVALGLLTWVRTARMIRGSILQLKEKEYVEAAKASGASPFYIITRHLIPNCISTIIVLVTLGIIGVVSAMTVPTLMQNHQRKTYVTQLHKFYNELSQAVLQYQTDKNAVNLKEAGLNSNENVYNFIKTYFKVVQECDSMTDCFADEYKSISGVTVTSFDTNYKSFVLANGVSLRPIYSAYAGGGFANNKKLLNIGVDINGKKGPNIAGRDLFWLYVYNNGLIDDMPPTETADAPLTKDQREELYQQYCLGNTDSGCFGKILNDNWEMTY